ncbi:hypothetical protein V9K67_02150 [Paraflavisolibacter sp. H34]|uniref:hypothetical protein n=1 Tax=Huijunlia imazamoxiresistens TaxID=3127457 RepID=UPI00301AF384
MKWKIALAVLIPWMFTSCMKSLANEDVEAVVVPEAFNHQKLVGTSARELLTDEKYTSLKVEIQYMNGFAPSRETLRNLHGFLNKYLNKPGGIIIVTKEINPEALGALTIDKVRALEKDYRTVYTTGKQLSLYILFTDGSHEDNRIFGCAYNNTSAVVFGKSVHDRSGDIGRPHRAKLESSVLLHEMGHLLGLVNTGSATVDSHHDDAHAKHCTNQQCLMYFQTEIRDPFDYLLRGKMPELDSACAADLRANGAKR